MALDMNPGFSIRAEDCHYIDTDEITNLCEHYAHPLRVLHLNIRSLRANYDELLNLLVSYEENHRALHVLLLCETALSDANTALYSIPGFDSVHANRKTQQRGGVAIFVRKGLNFSQRPDLSIFSEGKFESIFIEISPSKNIQPIIIGEIYRVPSLNAPDTISFFNSFTSLLHSSNANVIFGTDQNLDLGKIDDHTLTRNVYNLLESEGFLPTVNVPTRIEGDTKTIIDNIYIRGSLPSTRTSVVKAKIADHLPIVLTVDLHMQYKKKSPLVVTQRKMDETIVQRIIDELGLCDWQALENLNIDSAFEFFLSKMNAVLDLHAPVKQIKIPSKSIRREPWFTKGLQKSSRRLSKLYAMAANFAKNSQQHTAYVKYRNVYNSTKRAAKQIFYDNLFNESKNDVKRTWKILNNLTKKRGKDNSPIEKLLVNDATINEPKEIADAFARFFADVGPKQAGSITPHAQTDDPPYRTYRDVTPIHQSVFLHPVTHLEIIRIVDSLKNKKSLGLDLVSTNFVKKLKHALSAPLSTLINKSFCDGAFPNLLKRAKTIPIFKTGERFNMDNYRPISLLPIFGKIFEKAYCSRLMSFLEEHRILCESQYGFRRKRNTTNAVSELYLNAINAMLKNEITLATFIDFSKAFDTIDHRILLDKMPSYGIRGRALDWIRSYLSNRSMTVSIQGCLSEEVQLSQYGVPQGSIIGPILYIIYANDLNACLTHAKAIFYADDTTLFLSGKFANNLAEHMNDDLGRVKNWCDANSLVVNIKKTKFMLIGLNAQTSCKIGISMANQEIERVTAFKFLGIIIDERLTWKAHIESLNKKLSSGLYALRNTKKLASRTGLLSLYHSLIHCHLSYGCLIWGSASDNALKPLKIAQKKAIRLVHTASYNAHSTPLFLRSNVLPLHCLINIEIAKFMHLHSKNLLPSRLSAILDSHAQPHPYATRTTLPYRPPRITSSATTKSLLPEGIRIWSSINPETRLLPPHRFTKRLKRKYLNELTTS